MSRRGFPLGGIVAALLAALAIVLALRSQARRDPGGAAPREISKAAKHVEEQPIAAPREPSVARTEVAAVPAAGTAPGTPATDSVRVLTGTVRSADGRLLEDADLSWVSVAGGSKKQGISERVHLGLTCSPVEHASTDEHGRFRIVDPRVGRILIEVQAVDHLPLQHIAYVPSSGPDIDVGELVLQPGVSLYGAVLDSRGKGVPDARLLVPAPDPGWFNEKPPTLVAQTAADGSFRTDILGPGPWALVIESEDHPPLDVSGDSAIDPPEPLEFILPDGLSISGTVLADPVFRREELIVRVLWTRGQYERLRPAPKLSSSCNAEGGFSIRNIPTTLAQEAMALEVKYPSSPLAGMVEQMVEPVSAVPGDQNVVIELAAPFLVVFGARDAVTTKPFLAPRVSFDYSGKQGSASIQACTLLPLSEPELGRHAVRLFSSLDAETSFRLHIRPEGYESYRSASIRTEPGRVLDLGWIDLEPRVLQSVQVLDDTGDPLEGASVVVFHEDQIDADPFSSWSYGAEDGGKYAPQKEWRKTGADGRARVPRGGSGRYYLIAAHEAYVPSAAVELTSPEAETVVRLDRGASVRILVTAGGQPVEEIPVSPWCGHDGIAPRILERTDFSEPIYGVTDADGVVVFDRLAPGRHVFAIEEVPVAELFVTEPAAYELVVDY